MEPSPPVPRAASPPREEEDPRSLPSSPPQLQDTLLTVDKRDSSPPQEHDKKHTPAVAGAAASEQDPTAAAVTQEKKHSAPAAAAAPEEEDHSTSASLPGEHPAPPAKEHPVSAPSAAPAAPHALEHSASVPSAAAPDAVLRDGSRSAEAGVREEGTDSGRGARLLHREDSGAGSAASLGGQRAPIVRQLTIEELIQQEKRESQRSLEGLEARVEVAASVSHEDEVKDHLLQQPDRVDAPGEQQGESGEEVDVQAPVSTTETGQPQESVHRASDLRISRASDLHKAASQEEEEDLVVQAVSDADRLDELYEKWLPGSAKKPESTPEDKVTPSAPLLSPARDDDLDEDDEDGFLISPHDSPAGHTSKSHGRGVKWSRQRRASKPSHGEVIVDMILARSQRTSKTSLQQGGGEEMLHDEGNAAEGEESPSAAGAKPSSGKKSPSKRIRGQYHRRPKSPDRLAEADRLLADPDKLVTLSKLRNTGSNELHDFVRQQFSSAKSPSPVKCRPLTVAEGHAMHSSAAILTANKNRMSDIALLYSILQDCHRLPSTKREPLVALFTSREQERFAVEEPALRFLEKVEHHGHRPPSPDKYPSMSPSPGVEAPRPAQSTSESETTAHRADRRPASAVAPSSLSRRPYSGKSGSGRHTSPSRRSARGSPMPRPATSEGGLPARLVVEVEDPGSESASHGASSIHKRSTRHRALASSRSRHSSGVNGMFHAPPGSSPPRLPRVWGPEEDAKLQARLRQEKRQMHCSKSMQLFAQVESCRKEICVLLARVNLLPDPAARRRR